MNRYDHPLVSRMIQDVTLPNMIKVRQSFSRQCLKQEDIPVTIRSQLEPFEKDIRPGMRIAITAGSRGIRNIPLILLCIVEFVRSQGGIPFLVPAMGSHGGATAKGQLDLLASLGITPESMGCPIFSSTETRQISVTPDGQPVVIDRYAAEADGIIVVNRIKPHTGFRGTYESGIMKMMAIGLAKPDGADRCHRQGVHRLADNIEKFGKAILDNAPILFAVAILENAFDETWQITALARDEISSQEPLLLRQAFAGMPCIKTDSCDVLVVDQIGKNFSGDGMDPNITGTFCTDCASGGINAKMVTILGLSESSHGNAVGIGSAIAVPEAMVCQLDPEAMYLNAITSTVLTTVRIPMVMKNHKECVQVTLRCCTDIGPKGPRIVRIPNSLHLEYIWMSEAYMEEIQANPDLTALTDPIPWEFDTEGNLF